MMRLLKKKTKKRPRTVQASLQQLKMADEMQTILREGSSAAVVTPDRKPMAEDRRRVDPSSQNLSGLGETPVETFLSSFRENGSECLCSVYVMKKPVRKSPVSGTLHTTLPEDVFSLVEAQMSLLDDYLVSTNLLGTEFGDSILMDALLSILRNLWYKQTHFRSSLLWDLESCIASANDFLFMVEKVDALMQTTAERYSHLAWKESKLDTTTSVVRREAADLISLLGSDAVYASQRAATFVMQSIRQSSIPEELFSREWEDQLVQNEVAVSMVRTFEDYLSDIHNFVEQDFLYHKIVAALVRSTVCFYVQCFVNKADQLRQATKREFGSKRRAEKVAFISPNRAICRMNYDVEVLRDYFCSVAKENASLSRVVANELSVLVVLLECMWLAVGQTSADSLEEFVVVLHKRTGANPQVTKHFLSDLWLLMGPKNEHHVVENAIRMMNAELQMVTKRLKEMEPTKTPSTEMSGLRLDEMLRTLYEDRILQEKSSVCGNILKDVKDLRDNKKTEALFAQMNVHDNNSGNDQPSKSRWHLDFQPLKDLLRDNEPNKTIPQQLRV